MKYLHSSLLLFIYLISSFSFAQAVAGIPNQYEASWRLKQVIRDKLNIQKRDNPINYRDIKGSPYLNEKFQDGEYFINGESQGHFYLRYNVYNDQIEILSDASPENLSKEEPIFDAFLKLEHSKVVLNGTTIQSFYYNDDNGQTSNSYFIVLHTTDQYTLLLRKRCVLTPAEKAATPNQADRAAKFTVYDDYYVLEHNTTYPKRVELNKRKFLKAFPDKEQVIKAYIKSEHINLKNETDLIKLFTYINTL